MKHYFHLPVSGIPGADFAAGVNAGFDPCAFGREIGDATALDVFINERLLDEFGAPLGEV